MAEVAYVFGDLLTGAVIEEIPLQGVSMTRAFGAGELRGSFQLDQTGKDNRDLLAATEGGRCFVVCERNGTPVWGGTVWTRTYQSQAKIFQLYCRAFEHYPEERFILGTAEPVIEYTNIEQRNIFRNLWIHLQATANTPQVTLPASFPDAVLKSLTVRSYEFKTYRRVMDSVANGFDGFDWTIDTARVDGAYTKTLRVGYPTLGSVLPLDFDYPGQILNYWQNDSMSERGTHIYGLGSGEGSTMLSQEVIHTDLLSTGFPRYDVDVSLKDINDATTLTSLAMQAAINRKAGVPIFTVEVKGDQEPEFGSYGLGDAVRLNFVDPRHINHIDQIFTTRILGWEYYPASDEHVEFARLTFEGED
jgi:hypothetical protein